MRDIILIAHDIRSTHNVGSLLRTAEGLGVRQLYLTGYTPYPLAVGDTRLPHIAQKLDRQIHKTALGAETLLPWVYQADVRTVLKNLQVDGYSVVALEQTADSVPLPGFTPPAKIAILLGREVEGVDPEILTHCNQAVEIPMSGKKESFNVVQAAAMMLYHCQFA